MAGPSSEGAPATSSYDCLLLDFGGVCLLNPVELHAKAETALGLEPGTLTWRGPLDPSTDELWRQMVGGEGLTEREYWAIRAAEVGELAGREMDVRHYMNVLYLPPDDGLVRPQCVETVGRAKASGVSVSVLTNDLRAFHGREWEQGITLLSQIDQLVDCSDTGILKPDRRAFQRAVEMTGFAADRILFVDDLPLNVAGAEDFGIDALWFDIADPDRSWKAVADRVGI